MTVEFIKSLKFLSYCLKNIHIPKIEIIVNTFYCVGSMVLPMREQENSLMKALLRNINNK